MIRLSVYNVVICCNIVPYRGMRQCLAHFLSEFSKFESNLLNGDMYSVSKSAVKKLRSLADDGSIEK